ncbi:replication factor C subunit 3 (RFC3) [Vairimorpha necatrix]|uniref:Replication factor C subunit 3 (RFC3) n=1 Tax=Vairimorpha necatrix TaxID=6039 RepID=A0AAX4JCJ0_9MICR
MNAPFVEKYRPSSFDQVEGNEEVIACLKSIQNSQIIPNMLFYGPPGTGKTTSIRILSNFLPNSSILELNASDERGISIVRHTIKEFASTFSKTIKLVILDEVDFMTRDAQNALRRIMEDFSSTTRFCLIANYPKKIISPILSRCSKFRFNPIKNFKKSVLDLCQLEKIEIDETGLEFLNRTCYGDMRKVINDVQAISKSFGKIDRYSVLKFNSTMSKEDFGEIFESLNKKDFDSMLHDIEVVKETKSVDLLSIIGHLCEYVVKSKMKNKMKILKLMSEIECRTSLGCNENVQLKALISVFSLYRD